MLTEMSLVPFSRTRVLRWIIFFLPLTNQTTTQRAKNFLEILLAMFYARRFLSFPSKIVKKKGSFWKFDSKTVIYLFIGEQQLVLYQGTKAKFVERIAEVGTGRSLFYCSIRWDRYYQGRRAMKKKQRSLLQIFFFKKCIKNVLK